MIIRRKLFSKEEKQERSKSDITSDVTVGAGMGALIAGSGRLSYEKHLILKRGNRRFYKEIISKEK